jgi:hypothetical protein
MRRFILMLLLLATGLRARAQDLTETISQVGSSYSSLYVAPLVDAYGAGINAGLFHTASVGGGVIPGVDLYAGIKVFGAMVPPEMQTFNAQYSADQVVTGPDGRQYVVPVDFSIEDAPTVFGTGSAGSAVARIDRTVHSGSDGIPGTVDDVVIDETLRLPTLPGLAATTVAPLAVPQFGIGSLFGTDIMIRYLPSIRWWRFGMLSLTGVGIRHNVSQHFGALPVQVSVQAVLQDLTLQDTATERQTLRARAMALNLAVSKSLAIVTLYGGVQVEQTSVDVDYTVDTGISEVPSTRVQFSQTAQNRYRLIGGLNLGLGPLQVNMDYALGALNTVTIGAGIAL